MQLTCRCRRVGYLAVKEKKSNDNHNNMTIMTREINIYVKVLSFLPKKARIFSLSWKTWAFLDVKNNIMNGTAHRLIINEYCEMFWHERRIWKRDESRERKIDLMSCHEFLPVNYFPSPSSLLLLHPLFFFIMRASLVIRALV